MISHNWPRLQLEEVAEVAAGNPAPQDTTDFSEDGEPFVRMQDVGREHRTSCLTVSVDKVSAEAIARHRLRLFPAGSVLVPKSGASVNLNHRAMLGRDAYVVSHLAVLVPNPERVIPEYLYAWSQSYDPRHQAQTTSLPSLPLSLIKAAEMPVPPIPEQLSIVDILSRAEGVVRLRRDAEKKAAELIPALFLDMFGDPATNPKGWPVAALGDVCTINPKLDKHQKPTTDSIVSFVPMAAVDGIRGEVATIEPKSYASVAKGYTSFIEGDVLFAKITPCMENGKAAIVPELIGGYGFGSTEFHVLRPTKHLHQAWIFGLVRRESFRQQAKLNFSGTAGQQRVPADFLKLLNVPVPDFKTQIAFAQALGQIRSIQTQQSAAAAKAQATFDALLAQIFI